MKFEGASEYLTLWGNRFYKELCKWRDLSVGDLLKKQPIYYNRGIPNDLNKL